MSIYNRENQYINLLAQAPHSVRELSEKLFISEPTVRRDIAVLQEKGIVTRKSGIVSIRSASPDRRIPLFVRHLEQNESKRIIARKAAAHIKDGYVIMLDASTTAMYLLSHISRLKNVLVITNGARTAPEAAAMGIKTICTGGELMRESFCYAGSDAESMLRGYNADVAFFSCRGISEEGIASDTSILENSMRKIMIGNAREAYLLCDQSKLGKTYLNTLCRVEDLDGLITE